MSVDSWEHFFKSEVRSSGRSYFNKGAVRSSQPSDTEVQAFIKGSTAYRVSFKSPSVESPLIVVDCTCPVSQRGQFCKHIWAALLKVQESHADFLDSKTEIQKPTSPDGPKGNSGTQVGATALKLKTKKDFSEQQMESREAYKAKQAAYRKEQYQKQKQRLKENKQSARRKQLLPVVDYPAPVKSALAFFADNGFAMSEALTAEAVRLAKKHLSRVFHPDRGGEHREIVELNHNARILVDFIESSDRTK